MASVTAAGQDQSTELQRTANALYGELVRIRQGDGLTADNVRLHGKTLCQLPAVSDELVRRRWLESDRPSAGVNVVECAIERRIRKIHFQTILRFTFNRVADYPEPLATQGKRLDAARKVLALGSSQSLMDGLCQKSYRELASVLLRSRKSPCDDDAQREQDGRFRDAADATGHALIAGLSAMQQLNALGFFESPEVRKAIYRELEKIYPRGRAKALELGIAPTEVGLYLVSNAVREYYPTLVLRLRDNGTDGYFTINYPSGMVSIDPSLKILDLPRLQWYDLDHFILGPAAGSFAAVLRIAESLPGGGSPARRLDRFYDYRDQAIALLDALMSKAEEHDWPILGPRAARVVEIEIDEARTDARLAVEEDFE